MLPGRDNSPLLLYDELSQYIEGWLQYKEQKKYERFWFVLRGNIPEGRDLLSAHLFCFKDLNIHIEENAVGSIEIHSHDRVEFIKSSGNKPLKCDFTVLLGGMKFHFRADDEISRERWLYALCELVAKNLPPRELPTERNGIRTTFASPQKKSWEKNSGPFHRSKTVQLPTLNGELPREFRSFSLASATLQGVGRPRDFRSASCVPATIKSRSEAESKPNVPSCPPRSSASLPFMLSPRATTDLQSIPWFFRGMSREEAQNKLKDCPVGYYLLRDSQTQTGSYTLAFKDVDRVKNHMISKVGDDQYRFIKSEIDSSFVSPQKAVEFYMIKKHSKTLTPTPYIPKPIIDDDERSYLLPSEMNLDNERISSSSSSRSSKSSQSCSVSDTTAGYVHRDLPPTPADVNGLRNLSLSVREEEEGYLEMAGDGNETPTAKQTHHFPCHTFPRQIRLGHDNDELEASHLTRRLSDCGNKYTTEPLIYGKEIPFTDNESYLTISHPDEVRCHINGEVSRYHDDGFLCDKQDEFRDSYCSTSDDDGPDYLECTKDGSLEKTLRRQRHIVEECGDVFEESSARGEVIDDVKKPDLPVKPPKKGISFAHYDDVRTVSYENQDVVEGAFSPAAPPVPPRGSKPELPRFDSSYVNT